MKKTFFILLLFILTSSANAQWTLNFQTPHADIVQCASAPDNNNFWFISNYDTLYKTSDAGNSWSKIAGASFIPWGMFVVNKDTAFKTASSQLFRTINGGVSWSTVFSSSGIEPPCVWMKNNSDGVMVYGGQIYKTTSGGATWSTAIITQPPMNIRNSTGKGTVYGAGNNLWVILNNFKAAYSSDFGITWNVPANTGAPSGMLHIYFGSPSFGIAVAANLPFIYVTTDGAASWHTVDNSLGANEDALINNSHCWYIPNPADHFYVKLSADSGATWQQQIPGNGYNILEKSRTGNTLWAGTINGKIYKYTDIVGIENLQTGIPSDYSLSRNYPNPFNPTTNIQFAIPKQSFVKLGVYDMLGREIETLVNEELKAGTYKAAWNASNYTSGVYIYKLTARQDGSSTGEFTETKKMVLVK